MTSITVSSSDVTTPPLLVIGGGQMARALIGGILDSGLLSPSDVTVVDPSEDCLRWWQQHRPGVRCGATIQQIEPVPEVRGDIVILAVKPGVIAAATKPTPERWKDRLVISIAAGVSLQELSSSVGHQRLIRVMPNTPALVGQGASAMAAGNDATARDRLQAKKLLDATGLCVEVSEPQLDAVTGLSGSGPAYVFLIIDAMADGGVEAGLPRDLARQLATQTVLGAAAMVAETGRHPGELKDAVASPGGTTIAGLRVLEQQALRGALIDAISAATARSKALGQG